MAFSHDGDVLMACTKLGEVLYYNTRDLLKPPIRRPPPTELAQSEGDCWGNSRT